MNEETKLRQLYEDMYVAMAAKDEAELDRVHDNSFVLVHMTGKSRVSAAVFGGGKHTWRLQLFLHAKKTENGWKLTKAEASTW